MENILNIIQPLAEAYEEDGVKEVFHALMDLIDKTLTEAQDTLNNALDTVKAKAAELEAQANAELDNLLAPLREQLDALIAEAEARVVAVALVYQPLAIEASGKDDVKKAFHELMDLIDKTLTEAQDALNQAVEVVKAKAAELEGLANGELDKLLDPLRKQLDDLIAEAEAKGFDVAQCQSYIDEFSNTPDTMVHNLIDCMTKQITQAQDLVNDAINQAKLIEQDLNTIDGEIDKCSEESSWNEAICYAELLVKIADDSAQAPEKIIADVTRTVALITELVPNLEACFLDQVKKAGEDAALDVAEFAICAAL